MNKLNLKALDILNRYRNLWNKEEGEKYEIAMALDELLSSYAELEKVLTVPTEQEVCDALSEELVDTVTWDVNEHGVYTFKYSNGENIISGGADNIIVMENCYYFTIKTFLIISKFYFSKEIKE